MLLVVAPPLAPDKAEATVPGNDGVISFHSGPNMYLVNPDGSGLASLSDHPAFAPSVGGDAQYSVGVMFSPDGTRVLFSRAGQETGELDIYAAQLIGFDGDAATRLTSMPGGEQFGRFAPDGTEIVFTHTPWPPQDGTPADTDIYVMNADGSNVRRLTSTPGMDIDPHFTSDGEWIVFSSSHGHPDGAYLPALFRMRPDGSNVRRITPWASAEDYNTGAALGSTVSPDGREVAYSDGRDIWITTIRDPNPARVTNDSPVDSSFMTTPPNQDYSPVFSPSGRWIAFMSNRGYTSEETSSSPEADIWRLRPDGTGARRVLRTAPGSGHPAENPMDWAPIPPAGIVDCAGLEEAPRVIGTSSGETLRGGDGDDLILGRGRGDRVKADDGADCAFGESGPDALVGQTGGDLLVGGLGDDVLRGGGGVDELRCGPGRDRAFAQRADAALGCEEVIRP